MPDLPELVNNVITDLSNGTPPQTRKYFRSNISNISNTSNIVTPLFTQARPPSPLSTLSSNFSNVSLNESPSASSSDNKRLLSAFTSSTDSAFGSFIKRRKK